MRLLISRFNFAVAAAVFVIAALSLVSAEAKEPQPVIGGNITTFTLENGLEVVVIPDRRAPVVTHMIWYKAGSADEPPAVSGIAHFLEHLMFKGTKNHPEGEFSAKIAELGGQENAFTSNDYTAYYQRVAKEHLELMMTFEADRMTNLILSDEVVIPERNVILEERAERVDNDPSARLGEALEAALYVQHPYGIPVIGWKHEMEQLSGADAISFYERYYTPNNAVLVVAGDVEAEDVRRLAEKTYGAVAPRAEIGPRRRPKTPPVMSERFVKLADKQVSQPSVRLAWIVPSYTTAEDGDAEALDVMSEILSGGSTSRLYRSLVVDKKMAAGAGGWYQASAHDDSRFLLYAIPRGTAKLTDVQNEITSVIDRFIADGVTEKELERAKRTIVADAIYAQDSQTTLARIFGVALTTGGSVKDVQTWPSRIDAVTAEDVRRVAEKYLIKGNAVIAHLVPAPPKPKS